MITIIPFFNKKERHVFFSITFHQVPFSPPAISKQHWEMIHILNPVRTDSILISNSTVGIENFLHIMSEYKFISTRKDSNGWFPFWIRSHCFLLFLLQPSISFNYIRYFTVLIYSLGINHHNVHLWKIKSQTKTILKTTTKTKLNKTQYIHFPVPKFTSN